MSVDLRDGPAALRPRIDRPLENPGEPPGDSRGGNFSSILAGGFRPPDPFKRYPGRVTSAVGRQHGVRAGGTMVDYRQFGSRRPLGGRVILKLLTFRYCFYVFFHLNFDGFCFFVIFMLSFAVDSDSF